jgi:cytochrome b561
MPYRAAAIALHWILAVLIIGQILGGWYMGSLLEDSPEQDSFEIIHVSLGLTILLFTVARIAVRLTNLPPALPSGIAPWERMLSGVAHFGFYALMLALPCTGWALKSFFPTPIHWWGVVEWPQLPYFGGLSPAQGRPLYNQIETLHGEVLVTAALVLLALHVLGALKHQFDGSPVLWRMLPFMRKR